MSNPIIKIFIGRDRNAEIAYQVCKLSLTENTTIPLNIHPINKYNIQEYNRKSEAVEATDFSFARFFVPFLSDFTGISIFVDGDFLFLEDVGKLLEHYDDRFAIMCCKHNYVPLNDVKMGGRVQTRFPRKNWSSLMIFNNNHPKLKTLSPDTINGQSGAFLHQFKFLEDNDVGSIPIEWNWLVNWYKEPIDGKPKALHYTEGGPWLPEYKNSIYSNEFHSYERLYELYKSRNDNGNNREVEKQSKRDFETYFPTGKRR